MPNGTLESLLLPENSELLFDVLGYHATFGSETSGMLVVLAAEATPELPMLNGKDVTVVATEGGTLRVNTANVVSADIPASNGLIHVIDTVLIPPPDENSTSTEPSALPSTSPSISPSVTPTMPPSLVPSHGPSAAPSNTPSQSAMPTSSPKPSSSPSVSSEPSISAGPSQVPSFGPSAGPSAGPSVSPTALPSVHPSFLPSEAPSISLGTRLGF